MAIEEKKPDFIEEEERQAKERDKISIGEIKELKRNMEDKIIEILKDFYSKTGIKITNLDYYDNQALFTDNFYPNIKINIEISKY